MMLSSGVFFAGIIRNLFKLIEHKKTMSTKEQILSRLQHIESDLSFIKKHLHDVDLVLTDDDVEALKDAETDLKAGKTKRLA